MCCSCSQIYIDNKELLLAKKDDFGECAKHIFVQFGGDDIPDQNWDIEVVKTVQHNVRENFVAFLKMYYMYKLVENPNLKYPLDISYPNGLVDETDIYGDNLTPLENLLWCAYIAHRNLRKVLSNYVRELENHKEKKRQRRLRHKKNIREKRQQGTLV